MNRKHLIGTALVCFALGAATALAAVWALGTPWKNERVVEVEKPVERVVEKVVEKPAEKIAEKPPKKERRPGRVDLIVMQKNKPLGLDSDFSEELVEEARKLPGVESVSVGVVSNANIVGADAVQFLVQGWKPDNFGFEDVTVLEGRKLADGDKYKVMLGRTLADNLKKKVGDKLAFTADPDKPYEVVGVFKSRVVFEEGGAIVPFKDGQQLTGKRVTGFTVRVKKTSADHAADIEAVRQKIEALRDPKDPTVRLDAVAPERYAQ